MFQKKVIPKMEEWIQWQNIKNEKNIEIIIHAIENIFRKEDINILFIVEHNGIVLGESDPILIKSSFDELSISTINFNVNLPIIPNDKENINSIVSIPILIKAVEIIENDEESIQSISEEFKKNENKKKSIFSTKSGLFPTSKLFGICNFDIIPIILGEKLFSEKLILETPNFFFDGNLVSWQNLPRLTVTASQNHLPVNISTLITDANNAFNLFYITVESIYNIPETFTDNFKYKAGTITYTDSEIPKILIFDQGTWTKHRDIERTKRWNTLRYIENRAQLSKYKLDCDFTGIRNEFKKQFDLAKKISQDIPRIEWNSLIRYVMWDKGLQTIQDHIIKHKLWPFQFEITTAASPMKFKNDLSARKQLYQCYIDISELLFPGRTSCRAVGQLYTYNPADLSEKLGVDQNIFVLELSRKDLKEKDKKNKVEKSKNNSQSNQSEIEVIRSQSEPIFNENGEPTIVVVNIEFYEPLVACRIEEDFTYLINEVISKMEKKPPYVYSSKIAEEQYKHCIQKLAEVLTESYRDFCEENKEKTSTGQRPQETYCFDPKLDEITCFKQYLYKTGVYLNIRNTLRMKIPILIDQKFKLPANFVGSKESHNIITSMYVYLVEQMHLALNQIIECRLIKNNENDLNKKEKYINLEMTYFYAEETYELGNLDEAKQNYLKLIESNKNDPYVWALYAIFLKKIGDIESAKQCCLEAIMLDRQHPIALLIYAMIFFENKEYKKAEIFFRAIVYLHPRFFEGWAILHLFFIRTEYYPGVDLTLRIAEKCMQDKTRITTLDQKPLLWSTDYCPKNNLYINVVIFLLKLNFCEFAEIALAEEMSISNRSIHVLYYMAVEHYLSNRYEDALSHLKEIRCNYGMDYSVSSLMGHCYFKIGNIEKAIEFYQHAHMLFDRPKDLHLVEIRLGYHYHNHGDFDRAKRIFLSVCKSSPSCITWLGVGKSCYELGQFHEAEISLSEANRINNQNPEVWGYLCLLNMTLRRYDEFIQCYAEMTKYQNNLIDRKLLLRITNMMKALDYALPNLIETNDLVRGS
ncbi:cilia- and flagella-associated protein 70 [Apis laboriosa]|uniref:cilia- and flagella-associated protein 70 n=1 Tax=Apis laboriosa TaxID=183418 RepID=UPI001CC78C3C|nr:cilia- and flagella-associated protein 70 [Apis laboriosa]